MNVLIESETPRALNSRQSDPFLLSSLSGCGGRGKTYCVLVVMIFLLLSWFGLAWLRLCFDGGRRCCVWNSLILHGVSLYPKVILMARSGVGKWKWDGINVGTIWIWRKRWEERRESMVFSLVGKRWMNGVLSSNNSASQDTWVPSIQRDFAWFFSSE